MTRLGMVIASIALVVKAQTPVESGRPSFDVAVVRPVKPGDPLPPNWREMSTGRLHGRYVVPDALLRYQIAEAFKQSPFRVEGPGWMSTQRYNITATMPADTPDDKVLEMLQNLLIERFQLKFHWEDRVTPSYAMLLGKNGPKLKPTAEGTKPVVSIDRFTLRAKNKSLDDLAAILGMRWTDRPVVNLTGLTGHYDFELNWRPPPSADGSAAPADGPGRFTTAPLDALASLGLKAVPRKISLRFLIIDHAERNPSEN